VFTRCSTLRIPVIYRLGVARKEEAQFIPSGYSHVFGILHSCESPREIFLQESHELRAKERSFSARPSSKDQEKAVDSRRLTAAVILVVSHGIHGPAGRAESGETLEVKSAEFPPQIRTARPA
jgi:hypothetical protein